MYRTKKIRFGTCQTAWKKRKNMKRQFLFCPLISPASHCYLSFHRANSAFSFPINSIILLPFFLFSTHHSFTSLPNQTKTNFKFTLLNNGCNHFLHLSSSSSRSSHCRSCWSRILLPRRTLVPLVLLRRRLDHSEVVCSFLNQSSILPILISTFPWPQIDTTLCCFMKGCRYFLRARV